VLVKCCLTVDRQSYSLAVTILIVRGIFVISNAESKLWCVRQQAKIPCSRLCRCVGCKNFEESPDRQNLLHLANAAEVRVQQQAAAETKLAGQLVGPPVRPAPPPSGAERYRLHFSALLSLLAYKHLCHTQCCMIWMWLLIKITR